MAPNPKLIGRRRAARILGVAPLDLDRLTDAGFVQAVVVGGERMYRASDFDAFVAGLPEVRPDGSPSEPPSALDMSNEAMFDSGFAGEAKELA